MEPHEDFTSEQAASMSAIDTSLHPRLRLHRSFNSKYLPSERDVIVYVPPGYDEAPLQSYPVLYLHDGQNLFDARTSFVPGRTWQVLDHADAAVEAGEVEPLVIVGIYNTGDRRIAEYTHEYNWQMGGGQADAYGNLIVHELMPWIASRYRVRHSRASVGLGGSSLGGLVSLYLGLRYPAIFGKLALLSPSVWWNHKSILGYLNEHAPQMWERPRIWLDVGDHEGQKTLRDVEHLARRLKGNGWHPGETLHFDKVEGGTHDEASWATRVRPMLGFLFPRSRP
ncbi:alpha/beta hydrolase [Occallatibacter savannae]|uniref:alpha/beta hydrolase n=1 Tax=Occallatibacter savannae TaxID=1002691 RepID=UPI0013A52DB0|nr:alpha/beta hydrolase-fold protein [Occallatibacter savannae]